MKNAWHLLIIKCIWLICKKITGKTPEQSEFNVEGDGEEVANKYNKFLVSIITKLVDNLQDTSFSCDIDCYDRSMFLRPVDPNEIVDIANNTKNKHNSDIDEQVL